MSAEEGAGAEAAEGDVQSDNPYILKHSHCFGINGRDTNDNIAFIEDNQIVYPCGNNTVVYHNEVKKQRFIPAEKTRGITAMAVSPSKRYIAVAERASDGTEWNKRVKELDANGVAIQDKPQISIYDFNSLRRRRVLVSPDVKSREYVRLAFSHDGKWLLSQGGREDWMLVMWAWDKGKQTATVMASNPAGSPLYQCTFHPQDPTIVCVCGDTLFNMYRQQDGAFKKLGNAMVQREVEEPECYKCHVWLNTQWIVVAAWTGDAATGRSSLLLIENGQFKQTLAASPSDNSPIEYICPWESKKGFITGSASGVLSFYAHKPDHPEIFVEMGSIKISDSVPETTGGGDHHRIRAMALNPTEETLLVTTANNQLYKLSVTAAEKAKFDKTSHPDVGLETYAFNFHSSEVMGLDTCIRKPLVVTCGRDKSIRVWNYVEKAAECEMHREEEAYSIAFHPSGLHVLVGYSDKLRLMNLLSTDIKEIKSVPIRGCRECRFSNGGHMFAAVNNNQIHLFNTYTGDLVTILKGHNMKVKSICWEPDDMRLISAGIDGAMYQWVLETGKRFQEHVDKSVQYHCIVQNDAKSVMAVGNDFRLKEVIDYNQVKDYESSEEYTQVAVAHQKKILFVGTAEGAIRMYRFPLSENFLEYKVHSKRVNSLRVSFDESYLFSVGDDSAVYIFQIVDNMVGRDVGGGGRRPDREVLPFSEEILCTKTDLDEKVSAAKDFSQKLTEMEHDFKYQNKIVIMEYEEGIRELKERARHELDSEKVKYDVLVLEKNDMEMDFEKRKKQLEEDQERQMKMLADDHRTKLMREIEQCNVMQSEKARLKEKWEERSTLLLMGQQKYIQERTQEQAESLGKEQNKVLQEESDLNETQTAAKMKKEQVEHDIDREVFALRMAYIEELQAKSEESLQMKGSNGVTQKRFKTMEKELRDKEEDINLLQHKHLELIDVVKELADQAQRLQEEIEIKDETIGERELKIYELKKKNQELEKFKFVLDHKIKDLRQQIEPKDEEISEMKEKIAQMDGELERYRKSNSNLEATIESQNGECEALQRENLRERNLVKAKNQVADRFRGELHEAAQHIQEPKILNNAVRQLFQKYVQQAVKGHEENADITHEYQRQKQFLEKSVDTLKKKLSRDIDRHKAENYHIMQENASLIQEIRELRREQREMKLTKPPGHGGSGATPRGGGSRVEKELTMQRDEIMRLENERVNLEQVASNRPISRERLPPMDLASGGYNDS